MVIIQHLWCCWGRRRTLLASKPFRESDFKNKERNNGRSISLDGLGVEDFLQDVATSSSSLGHCLIEVFGRYHDHVIQSNAVTGDILKYKDVLAEAFALAAGLRSLGVTPGKLIGLLAPPIDVRVITILVASFILGAILCPIDPSEKNFENKVLKLLEMQPLILFSVDESARRIVDMNKSENTLMIAISRKSSLTKNELGGGNYYENILNGEEGIVDLTEQNPQDVLVILQTDGNEADTVLSNETLVKYSVRKQQLVHKFGQEILLDHENAFSVGWIIRRIFLFRNGGQVVTVSPSYEPEKTLAIIQNIQITWLALTLEQFLQLCDCSVIMGYDLSSLRTLSASYDRQMSHLTSQKIFNSIRERLPATRIVLSKESVSDTIPM